jgi:hypothetical protein
MPTSPIVQALSILGLGICLLALWKGSWAERFCSALILGVALLRLATDYLLPETIQPILHLVGDGVTALGLLVITIYSASFWLGGAMLLYAAQFTLHSYYFVTDKPNDVFHATVNNANFIGIIFCLAIGTLLAWRRRVQAHRADNPISPAPGAAAPPAP